MNKNKIQLEICKAILNGCINVAGCDMGDGKFAITPDGFRVFILNDEDIIFRRDKIKCTAIIEYLEEDPGDVEVLPTDRYCMINGDMIAEYCGEGITVFIDTALTKHFSGCVFYAYSKSQRVLVKDEFGDVVGMIMPVRDAEGKMEKKNALGE